jgi:fatty acid desaturase
VEPDDRTALDDRGDSEENVRRRLRADLPAEAFARRPLRALWFVPLVACAGAAIATIAVGRPAWWASLALGVLAGQCLAAMGFLAHEVLHGAVVASTRLQTFLGYLGFGPMLVSPTLWRTWHNQVHHGKTNRGNSDPDSFGTVARYEKAPSTRFVARLAPGSRHPLSYLFLGYWFMFHGQVVLWIQARYVRSFARMNRRRAVLDTLACAGVWIGVAVVAGPSHVLFAVVVPIVVTNVIVMGYIATNHFLRPLTEANDPLENSMSVTTPRLIDRLHFNFSHHVEHHLVPTMSGRDLPLVRAWLLEHEAQRYVAPSHLSAILALYRTPRVYLDATTLVDPDDPEGAYRADTRELADALR